MYTRFILSHILRNIYFAYILPFFNDWIYIKKWNCQLNVSIFASVSPWREDIQKYKSFVISSLIYKIVEWDFIINNALNVLALAIFSIEHDRTTFVYITYTYVLEATINSDGRQ